MTGLKIGYARVSTTNQDLTAQRDGLAALGANADRIYVDHGLTGTTRARPGLREALAACRTGGSVHDPTDPVGRLLFNVLAMVAEFEVMRTGQAAVASLSPHLRFSEKLVTPRPRRSQPLVRTTALARDA